DVGPGVPPPDLAGVRVGHDHAVRPQFGDTTRRTGDGTSGRDFTAPREGAVELHRLLVRPGGCRGADCVGGLQPGLYARLTGGHRARQARARRSPWLGWSPAAAVPGETMRRPVGRLPPYLRSESTLGSR